ncbi:hypothetical protein SAMN04490244_101294 [Tranquillimonas rosea]|uniref:Uncharacterized protein n=1 Tax=Tranquillimonas rosea TaxID=641238 RepID=A0A1H9PQT0_9RHOB|nr:hypothetical protein [Tranquillimonas rosea]SER50602.1 hypothetical protein SAMN04490244_101294 [Tranquillimonas rosea]
MAERDEWSPWIEHDGNGCPVPDGTTLKVLCSLPRGKWTCIVTIGENYQRHEWDAADRVSLGTPYGIVRYRIRRSRSFDLLLNIVRDAHSPESANTALVSQRISGGATNSTHGRFCAGITGPYFDTGGHSSPAGYAAAPLSSSLRGGGGLNNLPGSRASRETGTCGRRGRRRPPFSHTGDHDAWPTHN